MPSWGRNATPLVIAHRGASAERAENTLSAFALAEAQGADAVELDVIRCASGEVIVFHDNVLRRLSGLPGVVREMPLAALRSVRIGGEPIPTLDEVLDALRPTTLVNIELKAAPHRGFQHLREVSDNGLAAEVARIVAAHDASHRVLVSSFHPLLLARFQRAAPRIPAGLLFHHMMTPPLRGAWAARVLSPMALHPEADMVTARALRRWHGRGFAVNVWTVDDPAVVRFLAAVGVDGIITNRPGQTRAALGRAPATSATAASPAATSASPAASTGSAAASSAPGSTATPSTPPRRPASPRQ